MLDAIVTTHMDQCISDDQYLPYSIQLYISTYIFTLYIDLQHELQAGIACVFYIEQLVRHAQPQLKEKHPRKKLLQNLMPLAKVLQDLEVDVRTNPNDSWVQEFVSTPNHGHVALIDLIKDLVDNPYSVPRKNPLKYAVLEREPVSSCIY